MLRLFAATELRMRRTFLPVQGWITAIEMVRWTCNLCMRPELTSGLKWNPILPTKTTKILQLNAKSKWLKALGINQADPTIKQLCSTSVNYKDMTHVHNMMHNRVNYMALWVGERPRNSPSFSGRKVIRWKQDQPDRWRRHCSWVYFGGIHGAERIVGAYILGGWVMEVPSCICSEFKVEEP